MKKVTTLLCMWFVLCVTYCTAQSPILMGGKPITQSGLTIARTYTENIIVPTTNYLAAYWRFPSSNDAMNGIYVDSSDYGRTATQAVSTYRPQWKWDGGSCLVFDGVNDRIHPPKVSPLTGTAPFTITAWIKPYVYYTYPFTPWTTQEYTGYDLSTIYSTRDQPNQYKGFSVYLANDQFRKYFGLVHRSNPSVYYYSKTSQWTQNNWMHIALVHYASSNKFFLNGLEHSESINSNTWSFVQATYRDPVIGAEPSTTDPAYFYRGRIAEIRFYSTTLAPSNIWIIYTYGRGR